MGRVPQPAAQDGQRVHGEPALLGHHRQDAQSGGLPPHLRHRLGLRRHRQGDHALHDVTAAQRKADLLLQQGTWKREAIPSRDPRHGARGVDVVHHDRLHGSRSGDLHSFRQNLLLQDEQQTQVHGVHDRLRDGDLPHCGHGHAHVHRLAQLGRHQGSHVDQLLVLRSGSARDAVP